MVLCGQCVDIDFGLLIERGCAGADVLSKIELGFFPNPPTIKKVSFATLRNAAFWGCDLCSFIYRALLGRRVTWLALEDITDDTMLILSVVLERCYSDLAPAQAQCSGLAVQYSNGREGPREAWRKIGVTLASEGDNQYVPGRRSAWNPSLWCSWMKDCIKKHELCNITRHNGYTPTRLLDVGSIETTPKLVVSCGKTVEYLALSHCWGGSLPLQTTSVNLHDHLNAISWDALPATFQDAVKVTRSMGYRHLWIDCLCIIQDSEEDWLRECALMGEVYAGAAVTIAAEQSNSPSSGIFGASDRCKRTCSIPVNWPSTGASGDLMIGLPPNPRAHHSRSFLYGPLSKRGWVLQERVLSRRVLHLSGDATGFICSCSESIDSIRWPMPISEGHFRLPSPHMQDITQWLINWYTLVMDYSERRLTNAKDRLPAISGVARIISKRFKWTYVAGLWSHDLEAALLWCVLEPDVPLAISSAPYSGPSWSWASTNRDINYSPPPVFGKRYPLNWNADRSSLLFCCEGHDWASHYEVRHYSVELAGDDPFAEVKAGQLTIYGNMRPIPCPSVTNPKLPQQYFVYSPGRKVDMTYRPDQIYPQAELETTKAATWCFFVGLSRYNDYRTLLPVCYTIVLQAVPGSTRTFRRIGFMGMVRTQYNGDDWDEMVDWLLAAGAKEFYLI